MFLVFTIFFILSYSCSLIVKVKIKNLYLGEITILGYSASLVEVDALGVLLSFICVRDFLR